MKKHPVGELEKRHIRNLERKHREQMEQLRQSMQMRLTAAEAASYGRGLVQGERDKAATIPGIVKEAEAKAYTTGVKQGRDEMLEGVLRHSGRLFQERKDNDANAVREVYRLLSVVPFETVAEKR
jgi:hypothetical protein